MASGGTITYQKCGSFRSTTKTLNVVLLHPCNLVSHKLHGQTSGLPLIFAHITQLRLARKYGHLPHVLGSAREAALAFVCHFWCATPGLESYISAAGIKNDTHCWMLNFFALVRNCARNCRNVKHVNHVKLLGGFQDLSLDPTKEFYMFNISAVSGVFRAKKAQKNNISAAGIKKWSPLLKR